MSGAPTPAVALAYAPGMGTHRRSRRRLTVAAAAALVGLVACGDPQALRDAGLTSTTPVPTTAEPSATPTSPTGSALPATTLATLVPGPTVPLTTPAQRSTATLEAGVSWCPSLAVDGGGTEMTDERMRAIDGVAQRVMGVVNAYVAERADVAGSPWLDSGTAQPRVVIGFTRAIADHTAALDAKLAHPEELLVCQIRHGQAEVTTVSQQIQQDMMVGDPGPYSSVGAGPEFVEVSLRADQEALATDLVARYGDIVQVTVGLFPYPMGSRPARSYATAVCAAQPVDGPMSMDGVRATAVLAADHVTSGGEIAGTITITNAGTAPATFPTGDPLVGVVVRAGTAEAVGVSTMGVAGVGAGGVLEPGGSLTVKLQAGTASCSPDRYALAPGTYEVRVPVVVDYQGDAGRPAVRLVSEPVTVTVVG